MLLRRVAAISFVLPASNIGLGVNLAILAALAGIALVRPAAIRPVLR